MAETRFIADRMLGKMARLLRMTGQDVAHQADWSEADVVARSGSEARTILTRSKKLAEASDAILVRSAYPFHQARQILRDFELSTEDSFTRCLVDNGILKTHVPLPGDDLPNAVRDSGQTVYRCERCGQFFWEGSHVKHMRDIVFALKDLPVPRETDEDVEYSEPANLDPILDLHQAMDTLLNAHRVALMRGDLAEARQKFVLFMQSLIRHIEHEDQMVIPVYREAYPKGEFPQGASPEVFVHDHQKIREHLSRIAELLNRVSCSGPDESLERLALLDREKALVSLLEHHDHRERLHLYPKLESLMTREEKADLLERMVTSFGPWEGR